MKNRENNFDLLRLLAAISVIVSHSFGVLDQGEKQPLFYIFNIQIIPSSIGLFIFFVISGYLVSQSLAGTNSSFQYLKNRALRIFPALIVCNILCIFLLGIFFCNLPFHQYLFNKNTALYFWHNTSLYHDQLYLPGVFSALKTSREVNASLWTLGVECLLYMALLMLWFVKIYKNKVVLIVAFCSFLCASFYLHDKIFHGWPLEYYVNFSLYFFEGSILYSLKKILHRRWYLMLLPMAIILGVKDHFAQWMALTLIASCVVIFVATRKQFISLKHIDVSYGLYIYAFPVQQILLILFGPINPWLHVLFTIVFTLPFAFASWWLVEKPALSLKYRPLNQLNNFLKL
jgi:peptidoglycan/LPS O-acetylase OafA/YrhL